MNDLAEIGGAYGESGETVADFVKSPPLGNEVLVAVDGCEIDAVNFSNGNLEKLTAGLIGLLKTGVSALRNSVYASGGVIGVVKGFSVFISDREYRRSLCNSDGKVAVLGVLRGCKTGFEGAISSHTY